MARRRGIIAGGVGALALAALGYRLWDRGALGAGKGSAYEPWTEWRGREDEGHLRPLRAALLAASPHNTQPWLFEITGNTISVHADRTRNLGAFDPFRRELHLGVGCAVENLVIAARASGIAPTVKASARRLEPAPGPEPVLAAIVGLADQGRRGDPLFDAIPRRRTDRGPYRDTPVPLELLPSLAEAAAVPDTRIVFLSDAGRKQELTAIIVAATERIIADGEMAQESYRWLRTGRREILARRDGITLETSGTGPLLTFAGKMLPDVDEPTSHRFWLAATRDVQTPSAAVYGMVLVKDRLDMAQAIAAGRAWQRLHLAATLRDLAAQPLNQPLEMADRDLALGRRDVVMTELARLADAGEWEPTFVFRLGYPTRTVAHSPRRPLAEVLLLR